MQPTKEEIKSGTRRAFRSNVPETRLRPLIERFGAMLLEIPMFAGVYGTI
jgi:hypothetical protein